jgi:hypothetical protein
MIILSMIMSISGRMEPLLVFNQVNDIIFLRPLFRLLHSSCSIGKSYVVKLNVHKDPLTNEFPAKHIRSKCSDSVPYLHHEIPDLSWYW